MKNRLLVNTERKSPRRRKFIGEFGAAAAAGLAAFAGPAKLHAQQSVNDIDLLNFALNLEYLAAEFYTVVTTGRTIDAFGVLIDGGLGVTGTTSGGGMVPFNPADLTVRRIAQELADDERKHVSLLQNTIKSLGGTYVNKPAINLDALSQNFFLDEDGFLQLARMIEEIAVTGYAGLLKAFTSQMVSPVAQILAAEGSHSGTIRFLVARSGAVSGVTLDSTDIATPSDRGPGGIQYFASDPNGMTAARTPGEVLYLAYGGGNLASGGVFPLGVNGNTELGSSSAAAAVRHKALLSATPNPIPLSNGDAYGRTTVSWIAPEAVQYVQIRVGSPTGPLFTTNFATGSLMTNVWVSEGMVLYLQDVSNGKQLNAQNTLATLILRTYSL